MAKETILVIEDEPDIQHLISFNLEKEGYRVVTASSGEEGIDLLERERPDLMLLDLMLPGIDGLEVCRRIRRGENDRNLPVIMLTAKGEESDIVVGLQLGADDYVTKPFSHKELVARIQAVLRRRFEPEPDDSAVLEAGGLSVFPGRFKVLFDGREIVLTHTEFGILHSLIRRPGWVFTRNQLVDRVRGQDVFVSDRTIDVHIAGLRRKLGAAASMIETIRGVGYRFREE